MKKFLLFSILVASCVCNMWAVTDGVKYDVVNGLKIQNLWIQDRAHTPDVWTSQPYCNVYARTAVMSDGYIYIAHSKAKAVIQDGDTLPQSVIYKVSALDGHLVKELPLTLDGEVYGKTPDPLSCNTVGVDNFGHLYMAPYTTVSMQYQHVYMVDKETGEMTLIASLDKQEAFENRCDYIDVMGDITREQAECNIMAAASGTEYLFRWHADQGWDFEGGFEGPSYYYNGDQYWPLSVTNWGTAPVVKMVLGEDEENRYSGELFYVDGFTAAPLLFDLTGSLVGSFENVDPEFYPMDVGANGVCEFSIDGRNFIVFVAAQYTGYSEKIDKTLACQVYICELGEAMSMDGMQRYWMVPDALGEMTDTGTRVESMNVEYGTDENGNEQITLFIFKCFNGMAVYRITLDDGEQPIGVPGDVNGDGNVNIADINAVIDLILSASYSKAGDVNGDGSVNIGDINALISIILK